jgi:hypothetical protein
MPQSRRVGDLGGCPIEINRNAPATAEGELRIDADPQTVFAVISAIDQWPSWNPDVKSVQLQGPVQPGTGFRWKSGPSTLTGVLGGPDRQAAQEQQPPDPGQGHSQRPGASQDRGRAASRDGVRGCARSS